MNFTDHLLCDIGRAHQAPLLLRGRRNNKRAAVKKQIAREIQEDKKLEAEAKLVKAKTKLETVKVTAIYAQAATKKARRCAHPAPPSPRHPSCEA